MIPNYFGVGMNIVAMLVILVIGFYSIRLLSDLSHGLLETGWKRVATGALFLALGQILFAAVSMVQSSFQISLVDLGGALQIIGGVFIILGFKSQHAVWDLNKIQKDRHQLGEY